MEKERAIEVLKDRLFMEQSNLDFCKANPDKAFRKGEQAPEWYLSRWSDICEALKAAIAMMEKQVTINASASVSFSIFRDKPGVSLDKVVVLELANDIARQALLYTEIKQEENTATHEMIYTTSLTILT